MRVSIFSQFYNVNRVYNRVIQIPLEARNIKRTNEYHVIYSATRKELIKPYFIVVSFKGYDN